MNQEFAMNRHQPLCTRQVNNEVLLCSAGDSSQYLAVTYNEAEHEAEHAYVHVQLKHGAVHQKLMRHCELTILESKKKLK